jgi:MFS family permease
MAQSAAEKTTTTATAALSHHRSFWLFWTARVLSALGFQATSVVIGWQVYEKTGSAYALGLVGLFQFLPMLFLTFLVGHVADRYDRRRVVILCQVTEAAALAYLLAGVLGGWISVAGIFAVATLLGAARAFESPTISALLPNVIPAQLLPKAMAVSSSAMQTATIVGPSLGGVLYAVEPSLPIGLAACMFLMAAAATGMIRMERAAPVRTPVTLASIFSGVAFIRSRPVILGTISLDLFAVLLGGVTALLPIFAKDVLHTGPWGLGLLRSSPAIGGLLMSLVLMRLEMRSRIGMKMFVSVIVFGLATIVFAASTDLVLSCLALVTLGAADNVSVVIRNSLVLLSTPDEMRGRVNAVNSLFIGTSNQLGEFESGMVAGLLGAVPAGILGGIGTVLVALLWMRLFPALRKADSFTG